MMPVYKAPLMSPQNNSKRLGSATRRLQLTDRNGTAIDPQNYFTSQTPRITMNKQAYTFGGNTNVAQSPIYQQVQMRSSLNPEDQQSNPLTRNFFSSKQAYVKKQKSTSAMSTKSSKISKNFKTFYPPSYDKEAGHMPKLPQIQRFNEEVDTLSMVSKRNKNNDQGAETASAYGNLLSKTRSNIMMSQVLNKNNALPQQQQQLLQANDQDQQLNKEKQQLDEDQEHQSELYDEINSLYDLENQQDDRKSVFTSVSKAKSTMSMKSQVIITSLEKQLQEERDARKKLEEELASIRQLSMQLLKNQQQIQKQQ
eukprot:403359387